MYHIGTDERVAFTIASNAKKPPRSSIHFLLKSEKVMICVMKAFLGFLCIARNGKGPSKPLLAMV